MAFDRIVQEDRWSAALPVMRRFPARRRIDALDGSAGLLSAFSALFPGVGRRQPEVWLQPLAWRAWLGPRSDCKGRG